MDPVTHGLIGAAATQSFSNQHNIRQVSFVGFCSALLPDLDIFISRASDPLLNLEFHRQFSHSLIFIPVGALIASALIWWIVKKKLSFKQTYLYSLLAYGTAGLADTATSYGVQLLWPFLDERFAWNIISVFDPLFSLVLMLATGFALYKKKPKIAWLGIGWMVLYLSFGFIQQQRAHETAYQIAEDNNHRIKQLSVKPTMANELLWSIRYVYSESLHTYGVRLSPFGESIIYDGNSAALLPWKQKYASYRGMVMYEDIQRFSKLSGGILIQHPDHKNVIGDGRYSMLPTSVAPLWGIEIDTTRPNIHVAFDTYRKPTKEVRTRFKNMLFGKDEFQ